MDYAMPHADTSAFETGPLSEVPSANQPMGQRRRRGRPSRRRWRDHQCRCRCVADLGRPTHIEHAASPERV